MTWQTLKNDGTYTTLGVYDLYLIYVSLPKRPRAVHVYNRGLPTRCTLPKTILNWFLRAERNMSVP